MLLELSHPISPTTPVYPGVDQSSYVSANRMSRGGPNNATYVRHFLHTGTHVDAPFHFDDEGLTIDRVPINEFVYSAALVLSIRKKRGELITPADLENHKAALSRADLVLFHTGYCHYINDVGVYQDDFPAIDLEVARMFRDELLNVVAIGIDTLGIESLAGPDSGFPVHKQLLQRTLSQQRPLLIFENVNTAPVVDCKIGTVWALPIRFSGTEAAPVAIVAEVD